MNEIRIPRQLPVPTPRRLGAMGTPALAVLVAAGLGFVLASLGTPTLALAVVLGVPAAAFCVRHPAGALATILFCTGMYGTLGAFVPLLPALHLADGLLFALWISVAWMYVWGGRRRRLRLLPGVVLVVAYVVMSLVFLVTSSDFSLAFTSFRLTSWHLLAVVLIAAMPWPPAVFRRAVQALLLVGLIVGAYCTLRYFIGSSAKETFIARIATPGLPYSSPLRFFGSFPSAQELATWCVSLLPFSLGIMLAWRGRWRLLAATVIVLTLTVLLACDVRSGVVAAAVGMGLTVVLFLGARAFPSGARIGPGFVTAVAILALGSSAYLLTVADSPEKEQRFAAILHPGHDPNYQIRTQRWNQAWDLIVKEPFGYGLGTTGAAAQRSDVLPVGPPILDNSYLTIGLEQGLFVMLFFIFALLTLLAGLGWSAIRTQDPRRAAIGVGAAGTLAGLIVLMYGSGYVESPPIVLGWVIVGLGAAQFMTGGAGPQSIERSSTTS